MIQLALGKSRAFSNFRAAAGQNNHFLITILVGLDAVKAGAIGKNPEFSTTWEPRDVERSATRSRAYAIETSLVWVCDLVDVYRRTAQQLPGVCNEADLTQVRGDKDDGQSRQLARYSRHLGLGAPAELSLVQLGIHWRNQVVHSKASGLVDGDVRGALRSAADQIRETYNGLDVEEILAHEATGQAPTFKEIASIIHASHLLVEKLDRAMLNQINVEQLAETLIGAHFRELSRAKWNARTLSVWPGTPEKSLAKLERTLLLSGFQIASEEAPDAVGALPRGYLTSLSELSLRDARERFPSNDESA